jgi:hypothetical protein
MRIHQAMMEANNNNNGNQQQQQQQQPQQQQQQQPGANPFLQQMFSGFPMGGFG